MCIAYLALRAHPDWPVFIAANRDEFHDRPTLAAAPWPEFPGLIAGRDLLAGGTWLGAGRDGRYALLTNYREPGAYRPDASSRGALVADYLIGSLSPAEYARSIAQDGRHYNGYNLVVGDLTSACYLGNRSPAPMLELAAGRYVLSNHLLDTDWPKARRLRTALDHYDMDSLSHTLGPVFDILKDGTQAEEHALPETGLTRERERLLSSPFIISPDYGTRCSTVIAIHVSGRALFSEITYNSQGVATQRHDWPYSLQPVQLA